MGHSWQALGSGAESVHGGAYGPARPPGGVICCTTGSGSCLTSSCGPPSVSKNMPKHALSPSYCPRSYCLKPSGTASERGVAFDAGDVEHASHPSWAEAPPPPSFAPAPLGARGYHEEEEEEEEEDCLSETTDAAAALLVLLSLSLTSLTKLLTSSMPDCDAMADPRPPSHHSGVAPASQRDPALSRGGNMTTYRDLREGAVCTSGGRGEVGLYQDDSCLQQGQAGLGGWPMSAETRPVSQAQGGEVHHAPAALAGYGAGGLGEGEESAEARGLRLAARAVNVSLRRTLPRHVITAAVRPAIGRKARRLGASSASCAVLMAVLLRLEMDSGVSAEVAKAYLDVLQALAPLALHDTSRIPAPASSIKTEKNARDSSAAAAAGGGGGPGGPTDERGGLPAGI
eukprot:jgi/Mesen1/230/ME1141903C07623